MMTPVVGHLDPQYLAVMDQTRDMLRAAFRTGNRLTFAVSGTGMAGMEACLVNLLEPGDAALICVAGFFGGRLAEVASRAGARVTVLEGPWGEVFDPQQVREAVQRVRPKVVALVHAETSTGAWQPAEQLGGICREADALLVLDAVTSLGCVPVEVDGWGVDAVYSCSQKGLSCPPGLAPVSFSERAVQAIRRRQTKVQSWYLDTTLLERYWGEERLYHHTAPISMTYALREGLALLHEEGLEARWARHRHNQRALQAGLEALGMTYIATAGHRLPQLHAVRIPAGVDDMAARKRLLGEFGIEVGSGLGEFKGKAWRIGLMGHGSRPANVLLLLAALEQCLLGQGAKGTPGAAVAAAEKVYAA
jgi:alanine-glyoxylate transaminase/serine-glyoxylate transaminase/serine-pyruvate transaminase